MSKNEINRKAEQIIILLSNSGKVSLDQLCLLMNETQSLILLALGCLLKEGKVAINEGNNDWVVEGTYTYSHMYF
jgi:hypothetical protein